MDIRNFDYKTAGQSIMWAVMAFFWDGAGRRAKEELAQPPVSETAFLWPYCCFVEMLSEACKAGLPEKVPYTAALEALEKYRQPRKDGLTAYAALYGGYEDAYYDDNGWVVKAFLTAYEIFGDKKWLDKAAETIQYCYSGWDEKLGGGVYWRESDKQFKCLCSNAPLALFSLELYQATARREYLEWTNRLYRWAKRNFWEADGVYSDGLFLDGEKDRKLFPYNTAFMMRLELALFEQTGNPTLLLNAAYSGRGAFSRFCTRDPDGRLKLEPFNRPWFYTCLLEAYIELYRAAKDKAAIRRYIDYLAGEAVRAYTDCRGPEGFVSPDWQTAGGPARENIQLRDQAGLARFLFLLDAFYSSAQGAEEKKEVF